MIIYIDIDKTITCGEYSCNYDKAKPNYNNIKKVNELYNKGNTIVMWTARGSLSNVNWFQVTYNQLNNWGVQFHELRMGKPAYDALIDDKVFNSVHDWNNEYFIDNQINEDKDCVIKINDNLSIGGNNKCLIIAEVGQNHQGDINIAKQYIKACHEAGADVVKFQKSDLNSKFNKNALNRIYNSKNSFGKTYGEHKSFLEFSKEQYLELQKYANEIGITFTASGMDIPSFDFLYSIGCPILKVGSGDTNNIELLKHISKYNVPLILSTGMNNMKSVIKSVNTLFNNGVKSLCLMQCTSSYPLNDRNVHLNVLQSYKNYFGNKIVIGYSGHDVGIPITLASVAMGAKVIEKHVTFDKTWKGTDHPASLDMNELKKLCVDIRRIENALGSTEKKIQNSELACINKLGKSIVITRDIKKNDVITENDITVKVADPKGINPNKLHEIIGMKINCDKIKDDTLCETDLL